MISAGNGQNTYRGLVRINPGAENARNYSQCDSMLMGDRCGAHTFPYIEVKNPTATVEHEASTSKIGEDQIFYCNQRGIPTEDAVNMIVSGFCKDVFRELPMEFAVEAQKLLGVSLEGSVKASRKSSCSIGASGMSRLPMFQSDAAELRPFVGSDLQLDRLHLARQDVVVHLVELAVSSREELNTLSKPLGLCFRTGLQRISFPDFRICCCESAVAIPLGNDLGEPDLLTHPAETRRRYRLPSARSIPGSGPAMGVSGFPCRCGQVLSRNRHRGGRNSGPGIFQRP